MTKNINPGLARMAPNIEKEKEFMIVQKRKRRVKLLMAGVMVSLSILSIPVKATMSEESPPQETEEAETEEETETENTEEDEESEIAAPKVQNKDAKEEKDTEPAIRDDLPKNIQDGELNNSGKAEVHEGNGYLLLEVYPHAQINNHPIYISFFNDTTYEEYNFMLDQKNKYCMTTELPAGFYIIEDGGSIYDTKGLFQPEHKQFQIEAGSSSYVEVGIGITPNQEGIYEGDTSLIDVAVIGEDGTVKEPSLQPQTGAENEGDGTGVTMLEQEQLQEEGSIESLGPEQVQKKKEHRMGLTGKVFATILTILVLIGAGAFAMKMKNDQ